MKAEYVIVGIIALLIIGYGFRMWSKRTKNEPWADNSGNPPRSDEE